MPVSSLVTSFSEQSSNGNGTLYDGNWQPFRGVCIINPQEDKAYGRGLH